ncbi:hypothetical protein XFEB_00892 [Xylella fastidiosa EB92.1]|nr:hypothetical protein XFEB_00892 [Xylella fastidiosa EB92.1]
MYTMRILSSLGPTKCLIAHSKSVRIAPLRGAIPQAVKTTILSTTPPGPYPTQPPIRSVSAYTTTRVPYQTLMSTSTANRHCFLV